MMAVDIFLLKDLFGKLSVIYHRMSPDGGGGGAQCKSQLCRIQFEEYAMSGKYSR